MSEEKQQLIEFIQMTKTPGWARLVQMWNIQREAILNSGKKANLEGNKDKTMVYMAIVDGFDKATNVAVNMTKRYVLLEDEALAEEKERRENETE